MQDFLCDWSDFLFCFDIFGDFVYSGIYDDTDNFIDLEDLVGLVN